ncbi:unnamed protein product [Lathyrus sativus]|nr:unnamed protein product [Lathyrus sativus]
MTTVSTEFLSHTLYFKIHPNRLSCHSNPNTIVTCSTPLLNEGNTNKRRTRINQQQIRVNETKPKLDQNYDFRDTNSIETLNKLCKSAKYDEALYSLQHTVNRGYKPDVILCTKLIKGFFDSKKIEKAIQVMEILEKHGEPDVFAYNSVMNLLCKADRVDAANKVFDRMKKRGFLPDIVTYNILLRNLCGKGKLDLALKVMDQMLKDNCRPDVITYTILIEATIIEGSIDQAMKLLDEMLSRGLRPDAYAYNVVVTGMSRQGLLDRAFLCKNGHADKALNILEKLNEVGCPPNADSYNTLFCALWSIGDKIRALEMILEMLGKGIDPNMITYNSLISYLCRDGLVDQAIELLVDMMESRKFQPIVISYNTVILGLCKVGRIIDAIEVLAAMNQRGCLPNETTYLLLVEGIGFGGWRNDAMELANSLVNMGAISEDSFKHLNKAFPVFDVHKELAISE